MHRCNFPMHWKTCSQKQNIPVAGRYKSYAQSRANKENWPAMQQELITLLSPPIDSINYWFLRKSINLYGEVLIKTMARKKTVWALPKMALSGGFLE